MLNLEDLALFVAFYNCGTLSKLAEDYHISQPTLTRTMKRVEESFGVPLFQRSANRLEFNEVGKKAVAYAEELLHQAEQCRTNVLAYERQLHTLSIISCAPAPLGHLTASLSGKHPDRTISSHLEADLNRIEADFRSHKYDIAILPYPLNDPDTESAFYEEERLFLNVPVNHKLAGNPEINAELINGYNCLLSSDIGFWMTFCKTKLPNSRFLIQNDEFSLRELINESSLPCFTTNFTPDYFSANQNRINIPITDPEANVSFYLVQHKKKPM